jgi:hypothetical protein
MNSEQWAMVAVGLLACLAAIVLISYWGYRLFTLGLNAEGEVAVAIHNFKIKVSKSAPGIFFIIAGGVGLCLEIYFGFAIVDPNGWRVSQERYEKLSRMLASFDAKLQSIEEANKQFAALNTAFHPEKLEKLSGTLASFDAKLQSIEEATKLYTSALSTAYQSATAKLSLESLGSWNAVVSAGLPNVKVNDIDYVPKAVVGVGSESFWKTIKESASPSPTPSPGPTRPEITGKH